MSQKVVIALLGLILSIGSTSLARAETVLEQISRTRVLRVGVRTDTVPFGYLNDDGDIDGYSVDLIRLIHSRLEEKLNQPIDLHIKTVTLDDRFEQVENGELDLVCEATTITAERENRVDFSTPFFTTGIQMLVKAENSDRLDPTQLSNIDIAPVASEQVVIGFLAATTTDDELRPVYPEAKWQPIPSRAEGIEMLTTGELDGIASDGILLLGELWLNGSDRRNFQLVPSQPLTFENYGCILPINSRDWGRVVNSTITSPENTTLWNQWFDSSQGKFPYSKF